MSDIFSFIPKSAVCELTGQSGVLEDHHIFTVGSHPELKFDKRNKIRILKSLHTGSQGVHGSRRKELTFQMFDVKSKEYGWILWASRKSHSKLFVEWLDLYQIKEPEKYQEAFCQEPVKVKSEERSIVYTKRIRSKSDKRKIKEVSVKVDVCSKRIVI